MEPVDRIGQTVYLALMVHDEYGDSVVKRVEANVAHSPQEGYYSLQGSSIFGPSRTEVHFDVRYKASDLMSLAW